MELHALTNAASGRADDAARPGLSRDVAAALSTLANLIDDQIDLRGVGIGLHHLAARHLGCGSADIRVTSRGATGLEFLRLGVVFTEDLMTAEPPTVVGYDQEEPPNFTAVEWGTDSAPIATSIAACVDARHRVGTDALLSIQWDYGKEEFRLSVWTRSEDAAAAETYFGELEERAHQARHPLKDRTLEAVFKPPLGLTFRVAEPLRGSRSEVLLPDELWERIDVNVHGLFGAHPQLARAGLLHNRGVLLAGPPGTGKSAICRALGAELAGHVTVVVADSVVVRDAVGALYRELERLSPAMVILEDIDLIVGRRHDSVQPESLMNFLVALDGAMSANQGVVTLATTNAPQAIDEAARRSARFDQIIEVPPPGLAGRRAILTRLLAQVDHDVVDLDELARLSEGLTGADLKEAVSHAVLEASFHRARRAGSQGITTADLARVIRPKAAHRPGLYL